LSLENRYLHQKREMRNIIPSDPSGTMASTSTPSPNPDLTGHKLVIVSDMDPPKEYISHLHEKFSGLQVVHLRFNPWLPSNRTVPIPDVDWSDVTVLVTGPRLPTIEEAPKMRLVQLQSAGANYVHDNPFFKDTKIPFCTANGVHG
jgi:hypothetical protein